MRNYSSKAIVLVAVIGCIVLGNFSFTPGDTTPSNNVKRFFNQRIDSLTTKVVLLEKAVARMSNKQTATQAKDAYIACRLAYKEIEFLVEYYNPTSAKEINGALIAKVAEDDPNQTTIAPQGFQVIEEYLWEDSAWKYKSAILRETAVAQAVLYRVSQLTQISTFNDEDVFEAMLQEIIRVYTLGLAGFDAPASGNSIAEARSAFLGIKKVYELYAPKLREVNAKQAAETAILVTRAVNAFIFNEDLRKFNHAYFIQSVANPLYAALQNMQNTLKIPPSTLSSPLTNKTPTIFESAAWNANFYSNERYEKVTASQIALGKMLFFDPILSGNNKRACAGCHKPEMAFTDGLPKSMAFDFQGSVSRNAPSIINSAIQGNLFWDSRVNYLEDQVSSVTQNEVEMHGDFPQTVVKLQQSEEYKALFKEAFKNTADSAITPTAIRKAIAAYERSLVGFNSRFDKYMRGDKLALNAREIAGFTLFMSKAQCGTCHFVPTFGGTIPPFFAETEWEIIGVPATAENKALDTDEGRFLITGKDLHKFAFKTPSLRNVKLTAPYMHNGVYKTLAEVVDFYLKGGGEGLGYSVPNQTLPAAPIKLKKREIRNLLAFMDALSDTVGFTNKPTRLPQFSDVSLNKRKIGGEY